MSTIARTVAFLHRQTIDGRTLLGLKVDDRRYPVFVVVEDLRECIGSARARVEDGVVYADITFAERTREPKGMTPTIELKAGEVCTDPYSMGVGLMDADDSGSNVQIDMVGFLGAIVYVAEPAWPELKR